MEVLVVTSKVKKFIVAKANMNCSAEVPQELTTHLETLIHSATIFAAADGRKTVMGRDVLSAIKEMTLKLKPVTAGAPAVPQITPDEF